MPKLFKKILNACAIIGGVLMWLIPPKTPSSIIIALIISFAILLYPIWTFPFIAVSLKKRIISLIILTIGFGILGYSFWPSIKIKIEAGPTILGPGLLYLASVHP